MKKIFITSLILITSIISGCSTAQKASEVQSVRAPIAPYLKMTCKELGTEQNAVYREAETLGAQVDKDYQSDKNTELVTWILIAPAAFWMDGNAESAGKLAALKGQLETIQEAQKVNGCS